MFDYGRLVESKGSFISNVMRSSDEVFTPEHIVKDMLDMIPEHETIERTYLEPACGDGNFLVEIIRRKLVLCRSFNDILIAVSSVYAIDIQADNVLEARCRVLGVVTEHHSFTDEQLSKLNEILYRNIVLGDFCNDKMLKLDNEGYLRDFQTEERLIPLVIKGARPSFVEKVFEDKGNRNYTYDVSFICFIAKLDYTKDKIKELEDYFWNTDLNHKISFYSWSICNENLVGTIENLYDEKDNADNKRLSA